MNDRNDVLGVIVVPEGCEVAALVGGLQLLERQLLTLSSAGCSAIVVLGATTLPSHPRVQVPIRSELGEDGGAVAPSRALVVRADVASHRSVAPRLAHEGVPARGEVVRAGDDAAALFHVDATRVAEVAAALARAERPAHDRELPLLPGISAEFVLRAATAPERDAATQRLLDSLMKPTSGIFERLYMRPLSKHLTRLVLNTPVTPNQVTVVTTLLGLASGWLVGSADRTTVILGALLHLFMRVVDCVDGELARLRYQGSKLGSWLDPIGDAIGMAAFIGALSYRLTQEGSSAGLVGYVGLVAFFLVQAFEWWGSALAQTHGSFQGVEWGHRAREKTGVEKLVANVELLVRTDAISTYYGVAVLFDLRAQLVVGNAIAATLGALYFGSQLGKLRRRLA